MFTHVNRIGVPPLERTLLEGSIIPSDDSGKICNSFLSQIITDRMLSQNEAEATEMRNSMECNIIKGNSLYTIVKRIAGHKIQTMVSNG